MTEIDLKIFCDCDGNRCGLVGGNPRQSKVFVLAEAVARDYSSQTTEPCDDSSQESRDVKLKVVVPAENPKSQNDSQKGEQRMRSAATIARLPCCYQRKAGFQKSTSLFI